MVVPILSLSVIVNSGERLVRGSQNKHIVRTAKSPVTVGILTRKLCTIVVGRSSL